MKYKSPKIKAIVEHICNTNNLSFEDVVKDLQKAYPELWVKERCANCDASMAMYEYKLDVVSLLLLQSMGRVLREKMLKGVEFTEANKIHIATEITNYTVASHQTITSKLGLIAKVRNKDGSHNTKAGWCITRRGFDCLQDKPVPKTVVTFRNKIVERGLETTTMTQVYNEYIRKKQGIYTKRQSNA